LQRDISREIKYNEMEEYKETTKLSKKRGLDETGVDTSPLDNLVQNERIRIIIDELVAGKSKHNVIMEYSKKWNCKPSTIKAIMNEAIVYLHHMQSGNTIEELRSEQVAKLEELYATATTAEKLKIIDLVSTTLGLYDTNLNVKTNEEIKISLGV
jgi:hypothetical protein